MVEEGKKAPAFTLPDAQGAPVALRDFLGSPVVLYFYPKDSTPGCTQEACDFRDNFARLRAAGAVVLGLSADSVASHAKFAAKHELPFTLLSDEGHVALDAYGVWKQKSLYGKTFMGIERCTFVIDRRGVVAKIFRKVKVKGHVDAVLEALRGLE